MRCTRPTTRWLGWRRLALGLIATVCWLVAATPAAAQVASSAETDPNQTDPDQTEPDQTEPDQSEQDRPEQDRADEDALFEKPEQEAEQESSENITRRRLQRIEEQPLEQMSEEQARQSGFVFGDPNEESSRTSAAFLAATAGLLAHGVGHWYVDERRTAAILLGMEGAGLALMGSALAWQGLADDSPASQIYARPAMYAGLGLFGLSYLLDIIGTVQTTEIGLPVNTRRTRGISVEANYRYIDMQGYPTKTLQLLTAGSTVDLGWGYVGARTDQDVYLETSVYGLTLGSRPWRGPGRHTYLFVEGDGEWFNFSGTGRFQRLGAQMRAGVSLELGNWISQLRHVAVGAAAGYGYHWLWLPGADSQMSQAASVSYVPFEMFVHFNLTERLNARVAYEHQNGEFLQSTPPNWAVTSVEVLYRSTDILDLVVRGELGGGFGVTGGLRVWFWE